jgi:ATP-dependent Lon protease
MVFELSHEYYRTIKFDNELIKIQHQYLLDMMNNVIFMNNMGLFQDADGLMNTLLNELKLIKNEMDTYPNIIIKVNNEFSNIYNTYNNVQHLLLKYSNHISSSNLEDILNLFNFRYNKSMQFIIKFVKPINVWSSIYHDNPINYVPHTEKKKTPMPNILATLLGMKGVDMSNSLFGLKDTELTIKPIIIDGNTSEPVIMKTINTLIETNDVIPEPVQYNYDDCLNILGDNNIYITKNLKSASLLEDNSGVVVYLKSESHILVIQGIICDDLLNITDNIPFVKNKIKNIKQILGYDVLSIPKYFKDNYFKIQSLRDIVVMNKLELIEDIKKKYHDFKLLQLKPLIDLVNEFLLSSKYRKIDILTLLLMSKEDDQKVACILFDIFKTKDKKNVATEIYNALHYSIRELLDFTKTSVDKDDMITNKLLDSDIPYEKRIALLKTTDAVKSKAYDKLKSFKSNPNHDGKATTWLDGLLKIPFGIYNDNEIINFKQNFLTKLNVTNLYSDNEIDNYLKNNTEHLNEWENYKLEKRKYLENVRNTLDNAVHGHKDGKLQLERLFAQWINGQSKGAVIGLQGPPGTGKTSLAKHGLSKCLTDKNGNARPFAFLPIGGSVNSSTLVGHNFTYVGSTWGRIADILITTKCMNPIIFIDELDKVSNTEYGHEIISVLTHLTDPTQNNEFEDKYFAGIPLDLSKALIVFSFNDPSLIDPILKDRITIIETHPLNLNDKLTIMNKYMLPEICKDVGFNNNEIIINEQIITDIIETYTMEAGVRKLKEKIVELIRDINLKRFHTKDIKLPFSITMDYINQVFENKPRMRVKKIAPEPMVGLVNGLYATTSGIGGLTIIQLLKFPSDKMLDIQLTGKPGDMMKESVQYSLKLAWSLLPVKLQNQLIKDSHNKKSFGIHIHCPDAATPKDGPSAGAAFTLAIYSLLMNKKINNKICMTGEIDLLGNITAIGGIESKLHGGKKAGCTMALIPQENWEDYEILKRNGNSPSDKNFIVKPVSTIHEVIKLVLL